MCAAPLDAAGLDLRFDAARAVAVEAGALARRYFEDAAALAVEHKGVQDLVSAADREVEALIKRRLAALFPDDQLIGEETGGRGGAASWVIDPIDGTTNFLRGIPCYAVSIGFVGDGRIELGAIYDPSRDELYAARRGAGATLNGRALRVRETGELSRALMGLGFSHSMDLPRYLEAMRRILEQRTEFRRLGSAALGLAQVAAGRFDAFWQLRLNAWDVVAGLLLVTEAGGRTNDFLAHDGLHRGNAVLAATAPLYDALAALLELER